MNVLWIIGGSVLLPALLFLCYRGWQQYFRRRAIRRRLARLAATDSEPVKETKPEN